MNEWMNGPQQCQDCRVQAAVPQKVGRVGVRQAKKQMSSSVTFRIGFYLWRPWCKNIYLLLLYQLETEIKRMGELLICYCNPVIFTPSKTLPSRTHSTVSALVQDLMTHLQCCLCLSWAFCLLNSPGWWHPFGAHSPINLPFQQRSGAQEPSSI